jgi:uncharacterized membrane protein
MKSNIVFFDNKENSKRGTLRGVVIFPIFIILTLIWFLTTKKLYYKHIDRVNTLRLFIGVVICGILIVSAIGIHTPDTVKNAVIYGSLVGFVIYGVSNSVLLMTSNKWDYSITIIDTIWGILSTSLLSYIMYHILKKCPSIFSYV